ncbi:MAG: EAL domain-containing protein [Lachnospiraceae bacterium]|nr:EAL domain-containing protein [Lachnospiraceae bacterium]
MDLKDMAGMELPVATAIVNYDANRKIEHVNGEFLKMFGYSENELDTEVEKGLLYPRDVELLEEAFTEAEKTQAAAEADVRVVKADETVQWVQVRCSFFGMEKGERYFILTFLDISRQKKEEIELKLLNQKYEMMENLSHEYPFDLDVKSWKMLRSKRFMELSGDYEAKDEYYPLTEEIHVIHPLDQEHFLRTMQAAAGVEREGEVEARFNVNCNREDVPKYVWFHIYYKSVKGEDDTITHIIGRSFDIDEDKKLQDKVRRDPLTKLLNKMETQREVNTFLKENPDGVHVLFLIDIDNFKGVNDNFGHTFGDTVIMDVANLIQEQFRLGDVVGRIGGDEFLVLMKDTNVEKALEKAGSLNRILSKEYRGGEVDYHISASIGMAVADGMTDYNSLFEKADHAMYRAKKSGKERYEVANDRDIGPLEKNPRKIEKRKNISRDDKDFLVSAVSLMTHARNLDVSLNMILKRLAEYLSLDFVMLFDNSLVDETMTLSDFYSDKVTDLKNRVFSRNIPEVEALEAGNYTLLTHRQIRNIDLPEKYKKVEFSAMVEKFEYVTDKTGEIFYVTFNAKHRWKRGEIDLLQELTRIIAVFVSLRYRMDESEAQINYIQQRDQLTSFYNQDSFLRMMSEVLKKPDPSKVYALEYMDINNFGYVNENYGGEIGNKILKMFAEYMSQQEFFIAGCRLYSDFFMLLVAGDDKETLANDLYAGNKRFVNMQNYQYPNSNMGISVGAYVLDDMSMGVNQIVENATLAWKHAKNTRKQDIVFYDRDLRITRDEEQKVIGEFFEALYRDDFQIYLQPKFTLGERTVYGAEALARWKRPDGKILAPGSFIDSLEKIGYVTELDFYIYEEVLKTMERWDKQHRRKIVVSTNFSGRHFDVDGEEFLRRIRQILSKYSVLPEYVEIEITEGVMVQNVAVLEKCMNELHEMGFRVAIDDFGTGYSSLSELADMPADVVKIDKSFINKDMTRQKLNLLYEIGRMIRILNKDVIIEGVETNEQEKLLLEGKFTCGQGYLCSKPIPVVEFEKLYL